jgi:glycosyltransferase involved in cell wall biosynthesis
MELPRPTADHPCRILALVDHYLPGFKAGGPITTLSNMVEQLGPEFSWRIITGDRDHGDRMAYPQVRYNEWTEVGGAQVLYLPQGSRARDLKWWLTRTPHDVLYLNSVFSSRLSILPLTLRRLGLIPARPVVLAPRGALSGGALGLKWWKKQPFLRVAQTLGLHADVIWHASTELEQTDVQRVFGESARVSVAANLAASIPPGNLVRVRPKRGGRLEVAFLSGIDPNKNLAGALRMLRGLRGTIRLSIYGPVRDEGYWSRCRSLIAVLPASVTVEYRGAVPRDHVPACLAEHDVLLFPTLGENFGHVIHESLRAGCPVLISDRTPWRDLERHGAGWDLPLNDDAAFRRALERLTDMDEAEHQQMRQAARSYVARVRESRDLVEDNRRVFLEAAGGPLSLNQARLAG